MIRPSWGYPLNYQLFLFYLIWFVTGVLIGQPNNKFIDYKSDDSSMNSEKWTITLSESLDGNQWNPISTFKIPGKLLNGDS